jgi:hypothetical protein
MVLVELSEGRETSPGRCESASTAGLLEEILVVSRRLAREGVVVVVVGKAKVEGDVGSELKTGSAGGREVIIINSILACCSERP